MHGSIKYLQVKASVLRSIPLDHEIQQAKISDNPTRITLFGKQNQTRYGFPKLYSQLSAGKGSNNK